MHLFRFVRIILPALIGNILEWYEFAIYGYFAVDIAHQFFPDKDKNASLIEVFSILAIGFFMRPIGALVFGYLADQKGRKKILPISITLMALATTLIGFIPTYDQIGIGAAILLMICRVVQGFAVGGEYSSAITYIVEQTPLAQRGFFGSLSLFGAYLGILLGSIVAATLSYLTKDTPYFDYGWRAAFILGIFLGAIGLYIRKKAPETQEFLEAKKKGKLKKNPLKALFTTHFTSLICGTGMTLLPAVSSWLIMAYLPTYTTQYGHLVEYEILSLESYVLLIILFCIPLFGYLSDQLGRFPFLFAAPALIFSLSPFLFQTLLNSSLGLIFLAQTTFAIFYILSEAVLPATLTSLFPVNQRCTALALCINIANGFFGGTAPLIVTFLIKRSENPYSPAWYLMIIALISFIATVYTYKNKSKMMGSF